MPKHDGPDLAEDRNLTKYDYVTFMDRMLGGGDKSAEQKENKKGTGGVNGRGYEGVNER
jgi:hypothetical protein